MCRRPSDCRRALTYRDLYAVKSVITSSVVCIGLYSPCARINSSKLTYLLVVHTNEFPEVWVGVRIPVDGVSVIAVVELICM